MAQARIKTLAGILFLATWILSLFFIKKLTDTVPFDILYFSDSILIILCYVSVPIFFVWLTLGLPCGLPALFVTSIFFALFFKNKAAMYAHIPYVIVSFAGYKFHHMLDQHRRNTELAIEKIDEEQNVLSEKNQLEENDNFRIRSGLRRIAQLKTVVEDYSLTLSEDDILDSILKNTFGLFAEANRVLLYIVDTERQELKLVRSKKRDIAFPIRAKNGDVFDRWVFKHRMPLLVEDIEKDFRFSLNGGIDKGFNSLISVPIISEHKIRGILRVDSVQKQTFTQSDLRFLDIIADLSSVCVENAILYKKVQDLAIHDSLTGLYVHKYFIENLEHEVKRALRNNTDISLLMLDLDNFKDYNDTYGHTAGDLVLKHIASILTSFAQPGDIVARYGGEEFTVLLLNTDKDKAARTAEEIRHKVSQTPLVLRRKKTKITVSIGVASCPKETRVAEEFLMTVDARLYKAKRKGKNIVWAK